MESNHTSVAIIDCSINTPSIVCFNRMQMASPLKLTYHYVSKYGLESLKMAPANGYVILGSYSNVEDRLQWQIDLTEFIEKKLLEEIPVLGICFGHQLIADHFGCIITPNSEDRKTSLEGTRIIEIKKNRFGITPKKIELFVAHKFQIKDISNQFEVIATSEDCHYDGIQHCELPFLGLQSHPEGSLVFARENIFNPLEKEQLSQSMENGMALMLEYFQFVNNL